MYEDVLIPTDGSEAVEPAIERGIELAERYGATVHGLYVVQPLYTVEDGFARVHDAMESVGREALSALQDRAEAVGVDCVTTVRTGTPHREILDYVADPGVDLVVMGTHGRTGLERYVVGSVAERVVRRSPVPVMTVHPDGGADAGGGEGEAGAGPNPDAPGDRDESA